MPDLAEKWRYKTPTTLVFTLRRGVKFHPKPPVNGREVTAEDVKYSLERFAAKSGFRSRFDPVQSIEAVDRYTVRIALKEPFAPLLNHLANPMYTAILPKEAEEKFKDFNHPDSVIGTGPFILRSYEKGVRVVFERNPDYFVKGLPYLDRVVIEITPDRSARLSLLRAGKVEMGQISSWARRRGGPVAPQDQSRDVPDADPDHRPGHHLHAHATSRPSTMFACAGRSRWPSTARRGTRPCSSVKRASSPAPFPAR